MNEIRLARGLRYRSRRRPTPARVHKIRSTLDVSINSQQSELVTTQGHEIGVALGTPSRYDAKCLEPTGEAAPCSLALCHHALRRCHQHQRRQCRSLPATLLVTLVGLCGRSDDVRNEDRLSALLSLVFQPFALSARYLQRRRAVWFFERHGVEQE